MINPFAIVASRSRRTNFLSVGVTLCVLVAAICAAPLAFVDFWVAAWLLTLLSILVLGTFGIWAFHALRNPRLLDTEEHIERKQAISLLGMNQSDGNAIVAAISGESVIENPQVSEGDQE